MKHSFTSGNASVVQSSEKQAERMINIQQTETIGNVTM
jgi:hypothetical protein